MSTHTKKKFKITKEGLSKLFILIATGMLILTSLAPFLLR